MTIKLGIMRNIITDKFIVCTYDLKIEEGKTYDDCQIGKQVKISYKKFQLLTHVPDLIHMDLMGPVQDDILREKKYVFSYDNDYYIFKFIRDNSDTFTIFVNLFPLVTT